MVTGGDGDQSKPGICDDGSSDPPMIRCHPGGGIGMVRYRTVIYITGLPQTPIIVIVYTKDIIL